MRKRKTKTQLHPVVSYLILIFIVIVFSGILSLFSSQATYNSISNMGTYVVTSEAVKSLFSLSGVKFIFTNTVSNFANFTVLSNLIILLIGIGVMEKSGFLRTAIMLMTKKAKKKNVTFVIVLICILSSIIGDLSYLILIPITALIFLYGKRNPLIGIISSFAALTCGSGLSILFTSIDSSLMNTTLLNAQMLDSSYSMSIYSLFFINIILIILLSFFITKLTEEYIAKIVPKYEFEETFIEEEIVNKKELKGLVLAIIFGIIYLIIIIYNIIPGLPASGNLLDNSQVLYIDKLFSYESFFTNGYVFIIAFLFIILGFFYGLGAKTIRNNHDFAESLGYSLNDIGKMLVLIFMASTFISIFKQTNIGTTIVVALTNLISSSNFTGLPLILLLFIVSMISTIFVPSSILKWPIIASSAVPAFMSAGLSPEFAQMIFRMGESVTMGLTPMLAYFVIYLAYLEKYNKTSKNINFFDSIKYQLPYALITLIIFIFIIIIWYLTNFPLGYSATVSL